MREDESTAAATTFASPGKVVPLRQPDTTKDQDHLTWAYQTHVTAIYQYIYSRVGNRPDAEDLTAQVFMKAINGMRSDVSVPELRSWLYRVAQTTLADHWRHYYAEDIAELEEDVSKPLAARENPEAIQRVDALMATLPESYRRVLELRFLKGYSVRETAQELSLTETNVKVLQFRALNRAGRERGRTP
ncbi:MAG: sigma-70 family RNA polymerase sigma factor [Chloroflexi bacterium]|nr:MAG: sigma-70 family RNA polymerase sigma factor [Chloroflexota bacterium]TME47699.1 MAG: sigma-70 family RNA polymerase sigma factor [Chloroflexota bacterium]